MKKKIQKLNNWHTKIKKISQTNFKKIQEIKNGNKIEVLSSDNDDPVINLESGNHAAQKTPKIQVNIVEEGSGNVYPKENFFFGGLESGQSKNHNSLSLSSKYNKYFLVNLLSMRFLTEKIYLL